MSESNRTREARIILPVYDNERGSLRHVHAWLLATLIQRYGGATVTPGYGAWMNGEGTVVKEMVDTYDVAIRTRHDTNDELRRLARSLKCKAKQQSVYLRLPNGTVEFI